MIKLLDILKDKEEILVPRRPREERAKNYLIATQKKVQQYIKDGGKGNLELSGAPITSLPSGLSVGDSLYLNNCKNLTSLPPGLSVGGDLNLVGTKIKSLPSGLSVGGTLNLGYTLITSLPPGLTVKGSLYLGGTPITSLPSGLNVGGKLNLDNTKITSLPSGLKVGGFLNLYNTPLSKSHTEEQIRQMAPGVKGKIYM